MAQGARYRRPGRLVVNRERTRGFWIELGLKRPARVRKKQRCGPARHQRMRAQRPDQMWALDFGPELTAHALADWCRFAGVDTAFVDPGSPWQNGVCESFNGRLRNRGARLLLRVPPEGREPAPPRAVETHIRRRTASRPCRRTSATAPHRRRNPCDGWETASHPAPPVEGAAPRRGPPGVGMPAGEPGRAQTFTGGFEGRFKIP